MKELYGTGLGMIYSTSSGISEDSNHEAPHSIARNRKKCSPAMYPEKKKKGDYGFGEFVKTHSRKMTEIFCTSFFRIIIDYSS